MPSDNRLLEFSLGHRGYVVVVVVVVCFIVEVSFEVIAEAIYTLNATLVRPEFLFALYTQVVSDH